MITDFLGYEIKEGMFCIKVTSYLNSPHFKYGIVTKLHDDGKISVLGTEESKAHKKDPKRIIVETAFKRKLIG